MNDGRTTFQLSIIVMVLKSLVSLQYGQIITYHARTLCKYFPIKSTTFFPMVSIHQSWPHAQTSDFGYLIFRTVTFRQLCFGWWYYPASTFSIPTNLFPFFPRVLFHIWCFPVHIFLFPNVTFSPPCPHPLQVSNYPISHSFNDISANSRLLPRWMMIHLWNSKACESLLCTAFHCCPSTSLSHSQL